MARYGVFVYDFDYSSADMEAVTRVLSAAEVEVFEVESNQVFVNSGEVCEAVQALNNAGFITDEDETDE